MSIDTKHTFPAKDEEGCPLRIEGTRRDPEGRVLFTAGGHAYDQGSSRGPQWLRRRPDLDVEPLGSTHDPKPEPTTLIVSVYDESHGGGPVAEKVVTPLGRGSDDGRRLYRGEDGTVYVQRSSTGGQSARLSGVVVYREVAPIA